MKLTFDQNLFRQVSLDSGSLTMLGSVVHNFQNPGEYRGSAHKVGGKQAVFYISVDKDSSAASVNIDLASLEEYNDMKQNECCDSNGKNRFVVNPKGYVQFYVSGGKGKYNVSVRRAIEKPEERVFNSQELEDGDFFATSLIRPGTYSLINRPAKTEARIIVSYPEIGKTAYRPPAPVNVEVGKEGFNPSDINLKPGQGLIFKIGRRSRIIIELIKPDDGPGRKGKNH